MNLLRIGITQGDINGTSYELILKTFFNEEMLSLCTPIIYGSPKVATYHRKGLNIPTNFQLIQSAQQAHDGVLNMVNCFGESDIKIELGKSTTEGENSSATALARATEDLKNGDIQALVTLPIYNNVVKNGEEMTDQTVYIQTIAGDGKKALDMLVYNGLRISFVTNNIPISQVSANITKESVAEKIVQLHNSMKRDFAIDNPRIAVLALNPNFTEMEKSEESEIITPVVDELFKRGVRCMGPYVAEKLFGNDSYKCFDAILAMYHDQGIIPFNSIANEEGNKFIAGLPVIVTAPVYDTQYEIAGKNVADETTLRHAIYSAIDISRNRFRFDQARKNPLKKQYFEKRDDSDKLKLDQVTEEEV